MCSISPPFKYCLSTGVDLWNLFEWHVVVQVKRILAGTIFVTFNDLHSFESQIISTSCENIIRVILGLY
jgi:hypothetical protein